MVATPMHVSLAATPRRVLVDAPPCEALAAPNGARVILGAGDDPLGLAQPVVPSACTMFGPRGACAGPDGSLWVADTGHHRVLGWLRMPAADRQAAQVLLGQPAFDREGRNAGGSASPVTMNVPTGICSGGAHDAGLAVADAWNHRVLLWHRRPTSSGQPPDVVLGQADGFGAEGNRGHGEPRADTLFWPYGVAWDGQQLWVSDTGNRRVLAWPGWPVDHGAPAGLVLGQPGFDRRDENAGGAPNAASLRWPHAITFPTGGLCVADAGNNRLMLWHSVPQRSFAACDIVIGQVDMAAVEHNRCSYLPDAACLNMPYGAAVAHDRLIVADTANSRLLAWAVDDLHRSGPNACWLSAQSDWQHKGDNRWQPAARDSVCWPYAVSLASQRELLIADSGNNRVLLWPLADAAH
jgi:hypothetical protein